MSILSQSLAINFLFLIVGFAFGWFMAARQYRLLEERTSAHKVPANLAEINREKHLGVAANKRKILALLKKKGSVRNDDIEELLGVSDATATRYMRELVQARKVAKRGTTKDASYELMKEKSAHTAV